MKFYGVPTDLVDDDTIVAESLVCAVCRDNPEIRAGVLAGANLPARSGFEEIENPTAFAYCRGCERPATPPTKFKLTAEAEAPDESAFAEWLETIAEKIRDGYKAGRETIANWDLSETTEEETEDA